MNKHITKGDARDGLATWARPEDIFQWNSNLEAIAPHDDRDDPHQNDKEEVEGGEQDEEAPHWRHPPAPLCSGHDIIADNNGNRRRRRGGILQHGRRREVHPMMLGRRRHGHLRHGAVAADRGR